MSPDGSRTAAALAVNQYPRVLTDIAEAQSADGRERAVVLFLTPDDVWDIAGPNVGNEACVASPSVPIDTDHTVDLHTHPADAGLTLSSRDWRNVIQKYLRRTPFSRIREPPRGYGVVTPPPNGLSSSSPSVRVVQVNESFTSLGPLERSRVYDQTIDYLADNPAGDTPPPLQHYVDVSDRVVPPSR